MAILSKHVVMGKNLIASGSLAGEMKVGAISGSTGLTLNQMLIALDNNATATDASIAADAVHLGNLVTLSGVAEDAAHLGAFSGDTITDNQTVKAAIQLLETKAEAVQADVDANEIVADAVVGVGGASNLGSFTGATITDNQTVKAAMQLLESQMEIDKGRIDVINGSGNGSITKAIADLVDGAPGALDTLNELAAALADDAAFSVTITNLIGGVSGSSDRLEASMGAMINTNGDYVPHSSKNYINGNSNVTQDLIDLDAAIAADAVHLGNLVTLSGVAEDAANLGAFSGGSIADNQTVKQALQALETKVEADEVVADAVVGVGGASNLGTFTGASIADNQSVKAALQALETKAEADEAAYLAKLDIANGFHVEKDGAIWKMGWGVNSPRLSFEILPDATVTMSVDKETA